MDPTSFAVLQGTAGARKEGTYVDDVFSTHLYTGTGSGNSPQSINIGIDMSTEGGLTWIKYREGAFGSGHYLYDTERTNASLNTANANAQNTSDDRLDFTSTGFNVKNDGGDAVNANGYKYVSWNFRKAPGFFDVVTWTGNSTARTIAHSLGSTPGAIFVKRVSASGDWIVWHRSLSANQYLMLNQTVTTGTDAQRISAASSTNFSIGDSAFVNNNGDTYVAYVFAHDDQSFGENGDESIIKCGSVTTNSSGAIPDVNLGFEPQFLLIKSSDITTQWYLYDSMRGMPVGSNESVLYPNLTNAEGAGANTIELTSTGFKGGPDSITGTTSNLVYVAIRRPHKPPTAGTHVFRALERTGTGGDATVNMGITVDWLFTKNPSSGGYQSIIRDRLRGHRSLLVPHDTVVENTNTTDGVTGFDRQDGFTVGADSVGSYSNTTNSSGQGYINWAFKRAAGFFDMVAYTGTGSATTVTHNLGAVPSVVLIKGRDTTYQWYWQHYALGANTWLQSNLDEVQASNGTLFNSTLPTSSVFSLGGGAGVNASGNDYIAYLFGDLDGISKAGTYSGTGNNIDVDCGFTSGARFVLIKRADAAGDWYTWDYARGIVTGNNDPYLRFNRMNAQVTNTNYIDPLNAGFTVTSSAPASLNASGGTYIFLAIA